ncbi:MAG TPA: PIN domain-containing protein [Candidatus Binatia bacterium]|jgi:predicted nucleic acid-binding protein|nr:PIN domain-containing protein [Candidatus Binatia bacterium]
MANSLIDSDVYVDFLQSGRFHTDITRLYAEHTPGIYFSSVVIEELLAGAASPGERKNVELLYAPFERAKRVVAPSHANWRDTGNLLGRIFHEQPAYRSKLPQLVADCLIALSARALGATVYTRNRADFELIQRFRHFPLVVLE